MYDQMPPAIGRHLQFLVAKPKPAAKPAPKLKVDEEALANLRGSMKHNK